MKGASHNRFRHGDSCHDGPRATEWRSWRGIRDRCLNPRSKDWARYGGRGIEYRYESYEAFLADVGRKPTPQHSIDRIDCNGHYEPGNCRWATQTEQQRNRRNLKLTPTVVAEIRRLFKSGMPYKDISAKLSVSRQNVGYVVRGDIWKGV